MTKDVEWIPIVVEREPTYGAASLTLDKVKHVSRCHYTLAIDIHVTIWRN